MLARPSRPRAGTGARLGNTTLAREDARGVWMRRGSKSIWQDVRYALRSMMAGAGRWRCLAIGAPDGGHRTERQPVHRLHRARDEAVDSAKIPDSVVRVIEQQSTTTCGERAGGAPAASRGRSWNILRRSTRARITAHRTSGVEPRQSVADGADARVMWVGGSYFSMLGVDMIAWARFCGRRRPSRRSDGGSSDQPWIVAARVRRRCVDGRTGRSGSTMCRSPSSACRRRRSGDEPRIAWTSGCRWRRRRCCARRIAGCAT